jgi:hypothetical protein
MFHELGSLRIKTLRQQNGIVQPCQSFFQKITPAQKRNF